jgi:hypothetical protein
VVTYLVIELNSLDDLLIGIEQGTDVPLVLDELDVSNDGSSRYLGLVEIILNLGTLGQTLVLSIDMLSSQLLNAGGVIQLTLQELTKLLAHWIALATATITLGFSLSKSNLGRLG